MQVQQKQLEPVTDLEVMHQEGFVVLQTLYEIKEDVEKRIANMKQFMRAFESATA